MKNQRIGFGVFLVGIMALAACNDSRSRVLETTQSAVQLRAFQARQFDTSDKEMMVRAAMATLQDLGFVIDEANMLVGTVSATKLDGYALRMTISVRSLQDTSVVRASANFNDQAVEDPIPYQRFFESLEKAVFLEANEVVG